MTQYQLERQALQDAFVRQLLVKYNIKEVTTQKQAINGTREFEFPVSTYNNTNEFYKKWLKKQGRSLKDTPRLRLACFKSGYVRKQNGCYSPYQLNPTYKRKKKWVFMKPDGKGTETNTYYTISRAKIFDGLARLNYMLEYYLRNYNINTTKVR